MKLDIECKRRTNRLVHELTTYLIREKGRLSPERVFLLCQLTWWGEGKATERNKIRILRELLELDSTAAPIEEVAKMVAKKIGKKAVYDDVVGSTGFTKFYNAYRASSAEWIRQNSRRVTPLIVRAVSLRSDKQAKQIIADLEKLPRIPGVGRASHRMLKAENLLTPLFFALDPRLRFPIMNGAKQINRYFNDRGVRSSSSVEKYQVLVDLYRSQKVEDAAHLDCLLRSSEAGDRSKLNKAFRVSGDKNAEAGERRLTQKDSEDYEILRKAGTIKATRRHNMLTNAFLKAYQDRFELDEGGRGNMFDIVVRNFDKKNSDLLIEVKSSVTMAEVRMAIGQLFCYAFNFKQSGKKPRRVEPYLAVLLPERPHQTVMNLLAWCEIGLIWMNKNGEFATNSPRLKSFCKA